MNLCCFSQLYKVGISTANDFDGRRKCVACNMMLFGWYTLAYTFK